MSLTGHPDGAQVVIVGGGIGGLSTAFYLQRQARELDVPVRFTLVEPDTRFGGKIRSDRIAESGGLLLEAGPDSFLTQKPAALELVRDLGIQDQLIDVNEAHRRVFFLRHGKPVQMPDGMMLIVPTKAGAFARSAVMSPWGKLRLALDLVIPARSGDDDETLASFIQRRLGPEALDRLAEPLLSGIYNAEPERQSLLATFPRLREMEKTHGSLIKGMRAARRAARSPNGQASSSPFASLRGGLEDLVTAVVGQLEGRLLPGRRAVGIETGKMAEGFRVRLDDGNVLRADVVALALPAFEAARLVSPIQPDLARELMAIRYVSTGTVSLAYRTADVGRPLDGFGLVIPRSEGRDVNAISMSSLKFVERAPGDQLLLRAFVGGSRNPKILDHDDESLVSLVRDELRQLLGIRAEPTVNRVYRWRNGNPQYDVGHLQRVDQLDLLSPPGLFLTGSSYRGVGIPDCIKHGKDTATKIISHLATRVLA
ncbi:MAG TPA: protoporphyrinogen oxidase [Chloroflexota bacterium]|nr:protoporphyrinogen oxidase [Chloroflexota bacterium]